MAVSRNGLFRLSGLANLIAGLVTAAYWFIHPGLAPQNALLGRWEVMNTVFIGIVLFSMWGLTGLYLKQAEKVGTLGLIGYLMGFAGNGLFIAAGAHEAFVTPLLTAESSALLGPSGAFMTGHLGKYFMATGMTFALGYLLFGIASFRAGVLPKWPVLLAGLSAPILGTSPLQTDLVRTAGCLVYGLACAWLGWWLWKHDQSS